MNFLKGTKDVLSESRIENIKNEILMGNDKIACEATFANPKGKAVYKGKYKIKNSKNQILIFNTADSDEDLLTNSKNNKK